jgi:glycerol-3-phosphate dehydrogenase
MAEDAVDHAATLGRLDERPCVTRDLSVHGAIDGAERFGDLAAYGADAPAIQDLVRAEPSLGERLHPALPTIGAEVAWAARHEMARTVEDVLARRSRALFLDARAALAMAPAAAEIMRRELGRDTAWAQAQIEAFARVAEGYVVGTG